MSLSASFFTEARHDTDSCYLTPLFLDRLGNEQQEEFYRRAIGEAVRQGLSDIAEQAEAWLVFSMATREFEYRAERNRP